MSVLETIEELLLKVKDKHNTIRETISLIEEYKNNKIDKEDLIKQLKFCYVVITDDKVFGNYSPHDINNPYLLFNKLINDFNSEREEKINRVENVKIKYLENLGFNFSNNSEWGKLLVDNWNVTLEIIEASGENDRRLHYGLANVKDLIRNSEGLKIIAEIVKASGKNIIYVLEEGLANVKDLIRNSEDLRGVGLILVEIAKDSGENIGYVFRGLANVKDLIRNSEDLREVGLILVEIAKNLGEIIESGGMDSEDVPDKLPKVASITILLEIKNKLKKHPYRTALILKGIKEINSVADLENKEEIVDYYINKLGKSEYTRKIITENLDKLASPDKTFNRLDFKKTGSVLIPLGGRLTGYLYRIVTKDAYEVWLIAEKALTESDGTCHCEKIIKKKGNPRIIERKDGLIAVMTKYAGEAVRSYKPASQEETDEIDRQISWIISKLKNEKIFHRHLHDGNFTVLKQNDRIIIKIIDFDRAIIF